MRCFAFCGFVSALPLGPMKTSSVGPVSGHGLNERHHLVAKRELVRFPALGNGNEPQALFEVDVRPSRRPASLRRTPVRKSNLKYVAGVKSYSCTKASFLDPVNTETPSPAHGQGDGQVIRGDRPRNGEVGDAQIR